MVRYTLRVAHLGYLVVSHIVFVPSAFSFVSHETIHKRFQTPPSPKWLLRIPFDESKACPGQKLRQRATPALHVFPLSGLPTQLPGPFARASGSLAVSALFGTWMDRKIPNSGILATLVLSSLCSGFRVAPREHLLYDLCWGTFLPASLALLLLAMKEDSAVKDDILLHSEGDSIVDIIRRMTLPFGISSIGSLLGCFISFLICVWKPRWILSPELAVIAASCLSASFIGGSVNFFATAAAIAATNKRQHQQNVALNTLVSSMAAADLVVMAVYFVLLSSAAKSTSSVRQWFGDDSTTDNGSLASMSSSAVETKEPSLSVTERIPASVLVSTLALALVRIGGHVESALARFIPGTACAFLAAATPALTRVIPQEVNLWKHMQQTAAPLSSFSFLLLFAAIGVSADLEAALYSGPSCLVFAGLALTVHGIIALMGSYLAKRIAAIRFDHVLITSNAAIGGPATAATFCGTLPNNSRSLTVAATVWGVVGYAVGTTIGITVYRTLSRLI